MPSLRDTQQAFGTLLLQPEGAMGDIRALASIPQERLAIYQSLLRGTLDSCLSGIYPHTKAYLCTLETTDWKQLVERFRRACPNPSYMLLYAVEQFPAFLAQEKNPNIPGWLAEVAQYEWLEVLAQNMPDPVLPEVFVSELPEQPEQMDKYNPVWNTASTLYAFSWPVTQILETMDKNKHKNPEIKLSPKNTNILVYRDPKTLRARFFVLNDLTAALLTTLKPQQSYQAGLERLIAQTPALQALPLETVRMEAETLLRQCLEKGILLGSAKG